MADEPVVWSANPVDLGTDTDITTNTSSDSRSAAAARTRQLLEVTPWAHATERITLWLVSPPHGLDAPPTSAIEAWLAIDRESAQTLGDTLRVDLLGGAYSQKLPAAAAEADRLPPGRVSIFTTAALESLLTGEGRRALEARWSLLHAQPLADRLGRHARLVTHSSQLTEGVLERALRGAFLAAALALPALSRLGEANTDEWRRNALPPAGDATAALARIGCLLDEDCYPPLEWLLPATRDTRLGHRLMSWFDDLAHAISGDQTAGRRVANACEAVLEQTHVLVAHRIGEQPWMRDPASFTLRPPRG